MTARVLPRDEYSRLAGTAVDGVWPHLSPSDRVLVVERDGAIVGTHVLMQMWHLECLGKTPGAGAGVSRALWREVRRVAGEIGVPRAMTAAVDDRVRGLLRHVGAVPVPGDFYVVPLTGD